MAGTVGFGASVYAKIDHAAAPRSTDATSAADNPSPHIVPRPEASDPRAPEDLTAPRRPDLAGHAPTITSPAATPATAFLATLQGPERDRAVQCLTAAIYYEARNEPLEGQQAVAQVVLNRVGRAGYAGSVCGVVFQGSQRRTGCQFTFTCDGSMYRAPRPAAWLRSKDVAEDALDGRVSSLAVGVTNYHTRWIRPYWSSSLVRIAQIGAHIFYRGPKGAELTRAAAYAGHELAVENANWIGRTPPVELQNRRVSSLAAGASRPRAAAGVRMVVLQALEPAPLIDGQPIVLRHGG